MHERYSIVGCAVHQPCVVKRQHVVDWRARGPRRTETTGGGGGAHGRSTWRCCAVITSDLPSEEGDKYNQIVREGSYESSLVELQVCQCDTCGGVLPVKCWNPWPGV